MVLWASFLFLVATSDIILAVGIVEVVTPIMMSKVFKNGVNSAPIRRKPLAEYAGGMEKAR